MALFRKLFYRKPPDGLLEICERVYVFDCCFTTGALQDQDYNGYVGRIITQLKEIYPDASILAFNFREGDAQSHMGNALSEYDMTIMEYPRHYEGCPLLPMEMMHHFLRSSESWLSLGLQNLLLMHCERGSWPVLAFMLAALLIYNKHYSGELKTLDMVYKQAPRKLLQLLSPLNPMPSQLRYLQYVSRRNVAVEWPPIDRALTLDCIMIRMIPTFDGEGGCRPIFRVYGQDPFLVSDRAPKVLFYTPKTGRTVRHYKQTECQIVKVDINCHVQGDVVLECINLHDDMEREVMMFRVMFNTAFIRSNILMLNREEIDVMWDAKDQFPKDFRAEVLFSEMDTVAPAVPVDSSCFEEKDGLPVEGFATAQEISSCVDSLSPEGEAAVEVLQQVAVPNCVTEAYSYAAFGVKSLANSPTDLALENQSNLSPQSSPKAELRRERIAERMKALQELVPNANKTDKASMLDEIINYVKFLQLQVKVLSMSRLGGASAVATRVADVSSEGRGGNGTQTASASNNDEGMTVTEHQVATLMEEDMGSAMQYLQGKGLCLMPISLATAISTATSHSRNPLATANNLKINGTTNNNPLLNGGPTSRSLSALTVPSAPIGGNGSGEPSLKDATSVSNPLSKANSS